MLATAGKNAQTNDGCKMVDNEFYEEYIKGWQWFIVNVIRETRTSLLNVPISSLSQAMLQNSLLLGTDLSIFRKRMPLGSCSTLVDLFWTKINNTSIRMGLEPTIFRFEVGRLIH